MVANPLPGGLEEAYQNAGKTKATIGGKQYYAMQDMTSTICNNVSLIGDVIEVYDTRDNTIYHIGKLADNRCWLLDNLALNLLDSTVQTTMINNPSYTNTDEGSLTSLFSGNRTDGGNYATAGVSNWTSSYSFSVPLVNVSSKNATRADLINPEDSLTDANSWIFGIYYNYCAASAGSYCYGNNTIDKATGSIAADKANTAIDAEYDICPSGWRMPTGYSYNATVRPDGGEYEALYSAYPFISGGNSQYIRVRKALRLPLSGDFYNGTARWQGSLGFFWSSTYDASGSMYGLTAYTSIINREIDVGRNYAGSVRCINKTGTEPAPSGN